MRDPASGKRAPMQRGQSSPYLDLLKERIPGVRMEVLPGLGHFPQIEAPEQVNRLIEEFCR
jgi:pimeloyl-ACP methyl ester carboxylesterase